MTQKELKRRSLFTFGIVLFIAAQIYFWGHTTDDAYIAFRYVERFVTGHGLTFNDDVRVEGYSSPLWVLLLGVVRTLVPSPLPVLTRAIGIAIALVSYLIAWKIVTAFTRSTASLAALVILLIVSPGFWTLPAAD